MRCRHRPAGRDRRRYARHACQAVRRLWDGGWRPRPSSRRRPGRAPDDPAQAAAAGQARRGWARRVESHNCRGGRRRPRWADSCVRKACGSPRGGSSARTGGSPLELLGRRRDIERIPWLDYAPRGARGPLSGHRRGVRAGPMLTGSTRAQRPGPGSAALHV